MSARRGRLRLYVFRVLDRWVTAERQRQRRADAATIERQDANLRAWADRARDAHAIGRCVDGCPFVHSANEPVPCPNGFHWIGQSFAHCENCGLPAWEHDGMAVSTRDDPFSGRLVLAPWEPGEREAIKSKWAAGSSSTGATT